MTDVPVEHRVCPLQDLADGGMNTVRVGSLDVLLCRQGAAVRAVQPLCPHYRMPLGDGLLCGSAIHCSWHQSKFDLNSGALLEPPALEPLRTYPVRLADGWIHVTLPADPRPMSAARVASVGSLVLLGAGAAGTAAALRLREQGYPGRVVMITAEPFAPYDRPNLSKEHLSGDVPREQLALPLGGAEVVRVHRRAVRIDAATQSIGFEDGSHLAYDRLLLAPGSTAAALAVPGSHLLNVLRLRSRADGERLLARAGRGKRAVVVGSSFIGMEVAAALRERGLRVTVVTPEHTPFEKVLGPTLGNYFRQVHERHGVRFRFNSKVQRFTGAARTDGVLLDTGEHLPADVVVIGVGARPATHWLPPTWVNADGRVPVDAQLRVPGTAGTVFAAGDAAAYPDPLSGKPMHVEHWRVAEQQGRLVAENLLADLEKRAAAPFQAVPYFWSYQFGQGLDYVGHTEHWDEVLIDGNVPAGDFIAYYRRGDHIPAAAAVGRSLQMAALLEWMTRHGTPSIEQVRSRPDWTEMLRRDC